MEDPLLAGERGHGGFAVHAAKDNAWPLRERALAGSAPTGTALVIERAIARGEIDPARLSPRLRSLPVDLVRLDLIMTQRPVPEAALVEIVDRIFLPLVRG